MNDRLQLMTTLRHCYPGDDDQTDIYVEQGGVGEGNAVLRFVSSGCTESALTYLSAAALDHLSLFLAEAAQKLRYCTHPEGRQP
jgi:hypothetical protein